MNCLNVLGIKYIVQVYVRVIGLEQVDETLRKSVGVVAGPVR